MYTFELPAEVLIAIADVMGLAEAYQQRVEVIIPIMEKVEITRIATGQKSPLSEDELKEILASLKAKARRLNRTFKGVVEVASYFKPVRGLEAIGLDRVKQVLEETRRFRAEYLLLTQELDDVILKAARATRIGPKMKA